MRAMGTESSVSHKPPDKTLSVPQRLMGLCTALGIRQAHFAATLEDDWQELATMHSDVIASLSLIFPHAANLDALMRLDGPIRILHGEHANGLESLREAATTHPRASLDLLAEYKGFLWSDVAAEHPQAVIRTILAAAAASHLANVSSDLPKEGEIHGITYRTWGDGPPLFLLPLALAPSQWDPVIEALAEQFAVILLGGAEVGTVAHLEARGRCVGYREAVDRVLERSHIRQARQVLDVGCGTGVATRLIASCCTEGAQITAVDINRYLLCEACALADQDDLAGVIEFRLANAEMLDFDDDSFDLSFSITVMEEVSAKAMLAELTRVTRPDGRVAVVVRAVDLPRIVHAPLPAALKRHVETDPKFTSRAAVSGCADASLYRKFVGAGLEEVQIFPQLITYREPGRVDQLARVIEANLGQEDKKAWRQAVETAREDGTFFIAVPMHCAIGKVSRGRHDQSVQYQSKEVSK